MKVQFTYEFTDADRAAVKLALGEYGLASRADCRAWIEAQLDAAIDKPRTLLYSIKQEALKKLNEV